MIVIHVSSVFPKKNLALHKNAWTDSLFDANVPATKAVDGLLGTSVGNGECAVTSSMKNPWWVVDLGRPRDIEYVLVTARSGMFNAVFIDVITVQYSIVTL